MPGSADGGADCQVNPAHSPVLKVVATTHNNYLPQLVIMYLVTLRVLLIRSFQQANVKSSDQDFDERERGFLSYHELPSTVITHKQKLGYLSH